MHYVLECGRIQKQLPGRNPPSSRVLTPKGESRSHDGEVEALGVVYGQGIMFVVCFLKMFLLSVRPRADFQLGVLDLDTVSEVTQQMEYPQDPAAF